MGEVATGEKFGEDQDVGGDGDHEGWSDREERTPPLEEQELLE